MPDNLLCNLAIIYGAGLAVIAIIDLVRRLVGAPLPGPNNFLARFIVVLLAPLVIGLGLEHGLRAVNGEAYNASDALEPKKIKACVHRVIKKKIPAPKPDPENGDEQDDVGTGQNQHAKLLYDAHVPAPGFSGLSRIASGKYVGVRDYKNYNAKFTFEDLDDENKCTKSLVEKNSKTPHKTGVLPLGICYGANSWLTLIERKTKSKPKDDDGDTEYIYAQWPIKITGDDSLPIPNDLEAVCSIESANEDDPTMLIIAESSYNRSGFEMPDKKTLTLKSDAMAFGRLFQLELKDKSAEITGIARYPKSWTTLESDYEASREVEGIACRKNKSNELQIVVAQKGTKEFDENSSEGDPAGNLVLFNDVKFSDPETFSTFNSEKEEAFLKESKKISVLGPEPFCTSKKSGEIRSISELHYDGSALLGVASYSDENNHKYCSEIYEICDDDQNAGCQLSIFAEKPAAKMRAGKTLITADKKRFEGLTSGESKGSHFVATEQEGDGEIGYLSPAKPKPKPTTQSTK